MSKRLQAAEMCGRITRRDRIRNKVARESTGVRYLEKMLQNKKIGVAMLCK
jgi:hypothetical protein